jgi:sulfoxide reductase heme-binding subunit YedZ
MSGDPTFWLLARAAGLTAYVLLTCVVLAGLVLKSRPAPSRLRPAVVVDIHRMLSTLALGAVGLHAAALTLDGVSPTPPQALVIPGLAHYRPLWTSFGVVAAELMLVLAVSFPLRRRIGFRAWRMLHWVSYAIFGAATAHGVFAGTDSGRPAVAAMYLAALALVAAATSWRVLVPGRPRPRRQPAQQGRETPVPAE